MSQDEKSVGHQVAKGAVWMVAARLAVKGIGIVSIMILARVLTPDDFGVIALASSIYAMIELMRSMGFDTVLIQNQNAGREHYDTAWTLQIIFSTIAALAMVIISQPLANYYGDERLAPVLWVMGCMTFLNGLANIGVVEFRKKMTFNKEFIFQVLVKLSGFIVTIPLALYWKSYWAMLMGMLVTRVVTLWLSYHMQSYRPKLSLSVYKEILGFSAWLFLNNVLKFMGLHGQNFITAKLAGSGGLGVLSISTEIGMLVSNELVAPINRAAYPGYAKVAGNVKELKSLYLKILSHVALVSSFGGFVIASTASVFVPVLLGDKWMESIELLQIISISGVLVGLNSNAGYIYIVLGKPSLSTALISLRVIMLLPLIYFLSLKYQILGVAIAQLVVSLIMFPLSQLLINRQLQVKTKEMLNVLYRPIISGIVTFLVFEWQNVTAVFEGISIYPVAILVFKMTSVVVFYIGTLLFLVLLSKEDCCAEKEIFESMKVKLYRSE